MHEYHDYDEESNRRRVLDGRAILERTSESLARSHQVAVETEEIGHEVVSELGQQRETLLRAQRRLQDTDEELSQARRVLNKMYRNVLANKFLLMLIILLELAILGGSVYHRFIQK